jgi:hypothetical protein
MKLKYKSILGISLAILMLSLPTLPLNNRRATAELGEQPLYYLSVKVGDWVEYTVKQNEAFVFDEVIGEEMKLSAGDVLRLYVVDLTMVPFSYSNGTFAFGEEEALCDISVNNREIVHSGLLEFSRSKAYLMPFSPTEESHWTSLENWYKERKMNEAWYEIRVEGERVYYSEMGAQSIYDKGSGVLVEYDVNNALVLMLKDTSKTTRDLPLGIEWWRWALIGIAVLLGAFAVSLYYFKNQKRKLRSWNSSGRIITRSQFERAIVP